MLRRPDPTFPFAHSDPAAPAGVFLTRRAALSMDALAVSAYRRQGTEWGGGTFGRIWVERGWILVLIEDATDGVCSNASPVRVDIESESWSYGEEQIRRAGRAPGLRIGNWHSHPNMPARPSQSIDLVSWSGYGRRPDFVAVIVNPFPHSGPEHSCWALVSGAYKRLPVWVINDTPEARSMLEVGLR